MRRLRSFALAAAVLYLGAMPMPGQAQEQSESRASTDDDPRVIDEITVTRKRVTTLRKETELAQDRMFEVFNEHNSDDELDIHCKNEPPTGTRFLRRVCRPVFVGTATSRAGRYWTQYVQTACPTPTPNCIGAAVEVGTSEAQAGLDDLARQARRLDEEMGRLGRENGAFAKAVLEYQAKQREYREARQRRGE